MTPLKHALDPLLAAPSAAPVKSAWVLGIDPGLSGAVAALRLDGSEYTTWKMPVLSKSVDAVAFQDLLLRLRADGGIALCILEEALVMRLQSATSALTIGHNYGVLIGVLEVTRVPFQEMRPSEWKKAVIGSAPRMAARVKPPKPGVEPLGATDAVSTKPAKKAPVVRTVEDKKAAKELALIAARRLFPRMAFSRTEDGPAEALLMAESARRLVLAGSMGLPLFASQEEAQAALDACAVEALKPVSALATRLAAAGKKKSAQRSAPA